MLEAAGQEKWYKESDGLRWVPMTESEAQNEFIKVVNKASPTQLANSYANGDTVLSVLTRLHDWPDATKALLKKWGYDLPQTAKLVVSTDERIANRWINAYTSSGKNGIYKQWMSASTSAMHILAKDERISTDFPFSIDAINSCTTESKSCTQEMSTFINSR